MDYSLRICVISEKKEEPDYPFYLAKEEAISVCKKKFDILSIKETKSGMRIIEL